MIAKRVHVVPKHGLPGEGELLFLCSYPKANHSDRPVEVHDGGDIDPEQEKRSRAFVHFWGRAVQRVVLRTDDGRTVHYTVPLKVFVDGKPWRAK